MSRRTRQAVMMIVAVGKPVVKEKLEVGFLRKVLMTEPKDTVSLAVELEAAAEFLYSRGLLE